VTKEWSTKRQSIGQYSQNETLIENLRWPSLDFLNLKIYDETLINATKIWLKALAFPALSLTNCFKFLILPNFFSNVRKKNSKNIFNVVTASCLIHSDKAPAILAPRRTTLKILFDFLFLQKKKIKGTIRFKNQSSHCQSLNCQCILCCAPRLAALFFKAQNREKLNF
jgi:hypothetical protein